MEEDSGLTEVEIHSNSFILRRSLSEIENVKEHEEIEEEATLEEMNVPLRPGDEEEDDEHEQEVKDKTVIADGHDAFEEAEVEGIIGTFCIFVFEPINSWADASEGLLGGEQHLRGGADDEDLRGGAGASNATKKKRWWY